MRRSNKTTLLFALAIGAGMTTLAGCSDDPSGAEVPKFDAPALQQGRSTWMQVCRNCHLMGVAGAPAISDYPAWRPRLSGNRDSLYQNAINGIPAENGWRMPPRGGNDALTDEDVRRAVDFMIAAVEETQRR
jgi:cytochrome c5